MNPELALKLQERLLALLEAAQVGLGVYTLPQGDTLPAIGIGDPPEGTKVSGLEVILARNPTPVPIGGFEFAGFVLEWPIRLINWGGINLENAVNAIATAFYPFAEDPHVLEANRALGYPEQVAFKITVDTTPQGEFI